MPEATPSPTSPGGGSPGTTRTTTCKLKLPSGLRRPLSATPSELSVRSISSSLALRSVKLKQLASVSFADWLTAATDLARHFDDASLLKAVEILWDDMETKTYITGGIGSNPSTEGFSERSCS